MAQPRTAPDARKWWDTYEKGLPCCPATLEFGQWAVAKMAEEQRRRDEQAKTEVQDGR